MSISIPEVPANTLESRYAVQLDRTGTAPAGATYRTCLIGQKLAAGSASASTPQLVTSVNQARKLYGIGSQLALQYETYAANDPSGEVWCCAIADDAGGTAASGTLVFTGPATANGTVYVYVAGYLLPVGVSAADTATVVASAVSAAINAATYLPVTASPSTGTVTVTCRHKGTLGNDIDMRLNHSAGQELPAGIACTVTQLASGATDTAITAALTAIAALDFRFIVVPYSDDTNLDLVEAELLSRWGASRGLRSVAFTGMDDTVGNLTTAGGSRNSGHLCHLGFYVSPTPIWMTVAAFAGKVAVSIRDHAARPLGDIALVGVLAPAASVQFTPTERTTLNNAGIATLYCDAYGAVRIGAAVSTYRTDGNGAADTTLRSINASFNLAYLIDDMSGVIRSNTQAKILVADAADVAPGTPAIDPANIRALYVGWYRTRIRSAHVQGLAAFKAGLLVEINGTNPNRVDAAVPLYLAGQLNVQAVTVRPYLTLPSA
jgi:phage tail sheath gpL-like